MEKIENPFSGRDNYNCFGCSPNNANGLQMEFWKEGDEIVSIWKPKDFLQGYSGVLHGGVQAALLDELASWVVFHTLKTSGVTSKLEIKYKKPVKTDKGEITLRGRVKEMIRNVAKIEVKLFDSKNELCSFGDVYYFTFPKERANELIREALKDD